MTFAAEALVGSSLDDAGTLAKLSGVGATLNLMPIYLAASAVGQVGSIQQVPAVAFALLLTGQVTRDAAVYLSALAWGEISPLADDREGDELIVENWLEHMHGYSLPGPCSEDRRIFLGILDGGFPGISPRALMTMARDGRTEVLLALTAEEQS